MTLAPVRPIADGRSMRLVQGLSRFRGSLRLVIEASRRVAKMDPAGTAGAAALQVVGALAALAVVGAAKLALDSLIAPDRDLRQLTWALLLLAGATAVAGSMSVLQQQQLRVLGERLSQATWNDVLAVTTRVELIEYERSGFATRAERIVQNTVARPFQVVTALLGMAGGLLGVGAMAVAILAIAPVLLPVLLAAGVPAVLLARLASKAEFRFASETTAPVRRRGYIRMLLSLRAYAAESRAFGTDRFFSSRHEELNHSYLALLRRQARIRQVYALLTTLAVGISLAAAFLFIVYLLETGRITLPEAGAAAIAVRLLSGQLSSIFSTLGSLQESAPFLADLEEFRTLVPSEHPHPATAHRLRAELRVDDVEFTYPEQSEPALRDVNISIRPGEVVALVGENGSGKTTLAKIVAGLYEPDRGALRWDDGVISAADLRHSVSVTFQDFILYQMSMRDNVTIGDPTRPTDDADVLHAVDGAGARAMVDGLPDGLDTVLGRQLDEGVDLSGGQWQRLAIARGLYRERDVVVLDEPSAALDPRAESELFADVRRMLTGRAAILISHRLSSVRLADRIYVLSAGRVIDSGTHAELLGRAGLYSELYGLQAATYLRDLT